MAVLALSTNLQAQDLKILVDKKGKIGYSDQQGNEIVKCQYDSGQPFNNGVAIVTKSGKNGIIDSVGNVLLPLKYTQISNWNDSFFLIKNGKKMGLADHQGKIVLPVAYSHISKPNCYGKALIAQGGSATSYDKKTYMLNAKYGIIDTHGNILIMPKYKGLYEFTYDGKNKYPYYEGHRLEFSYHNTVDTLITDCSYLGFSSDGNSVYNAGIMDGNGKELMKPNLYTFVMKPQSNMVRYFIVKKKETLCGYHDLHTSKGFQAAKFNSNIDDINYWTHGDFVKDIAPVNGTSWSFIDKNGTVIRSGYTSIKHSEAFGLWAAKNSSMKWNVFDESNNEVSSLSDYEDIYFPTNNDDSEIFSVMKDGKFGGITRNGKIAIPFNYEKALSNTFDMIPVKKDGKWGIISASNETIIPTDYANVKLPSSKNTTHFWVMKADSLYYHYNASSKKLSTTGYKVAYNFEHDMAYVVPVDLNVEDTPINRAQVLAPHAEKSSLEKIKMEDYKDCFVNIININDVMLFDLPVSTLYKDIVRKELEKLGGRVLTTTEKKNVLLEATRDNRSYDLKSTLSEDEWNY